jgi:hypothetical protein
MQLLQLTITTPRGTFSVRGSYFHQERANGFPASFEVYQILSEKWNAAIDHIDAEEYFDSQEFTDSATQAAEKWMNLKPNQIL